jgi:proteic killer suppression protein
MNIHFADKDTQRLFERQDVRRFRGIERAARRKLQILSAATSLQDLRLPPGNRLEALKGDRKGWHSIRVDRQWRVVFRWTDAGPRDIAIVDYH